ncbi:MAG: Uma2 family endonuclease [Lachnospiraceae bacterium]
MDALHIENMSNTFIEHSIIKNFVVMTEKQIKGSLCRVLGDGVQYQWYENDNKIVIPDVSINCNTRDRKNVSLTGIPRMIMEVLSDATEKYDRNEKKDLQLVMFPNLKTDFDELFNI